jgi:hypothetical protein
MPQPDYCRHQTGEGKSDWPRPIKLARGKLAVVSSQMLSRGKGTDSFGKRMRAPAIPVVFVVIINKSGHHLDRGLDAKLGLKHKHKLSVLVPWDSWRSKLGEMLV